MFSNILKNSIKILNTKVIKLDEGEYFVLQQCEMNKPIPPAIKKILSYNGKIIELF